MAQLRRFAAALLAGCALLVADSGAAAANTPPSPPSAGLPPIGLPTPSPTPLPTIIPALPSLPATGSSGSVLPPPSGGAGASPPEEQQRQEQAYQQQQAEVSAQMPALYEQYGGVALQLSASDGPFAWPELTKTMSQGFGCTNFMLEPTNPVCPTRHWHTGLDIVGPNGTPVFAAASGIARLFPGGVGYGNYVIIIHSDQYATLYGHLTAFTIHDGDEVKKGDVIGLEGSTGFSTGPHLHFELRQSGNYVDPLPFYMLPPTAVPKYYPPSPSGALRYF